MQSKWPLWLGVLAGALAVILALGTGGDSVDQWRLAARWTARTGFLLFILTYCASSLVRLWPNRATKALLRDRRWWGLGFAACHTIHLGAFLTYFRTSGEPIPTGTVIVAGFGYLLLYAMAATSNRAAMQALGRNWKRLHKTGIHYLWFIFAFSYFGRVADPERAVYGIPLFAVAVLAALLRFAAYLKSRRRTA